ncbi:VOC family protein [Patescibacteria group bacterium]|nr:VOC family protein [Patescibacteria group bacterium]MBP9710501.1 VOC family protein [Patescibacteria group bacterium]
MKNITPHLWFDKEAVESAKFYVSVFPESKILRHDEIKGTPSGDCDILSFELWGHTFASICAGPYFKINPSISFMVNFDPAQDPDAATRIDEVWHKLAEGGTALMPLGEYPFSKRYGWIQDKYGVSWQLILTKPEGEKRPTIMPSFLFTQAVNGKTEEATNFYLSVFKGAKRGALAHYPPGSESDKEGAVMFTDFALNGQWFVAMDGGLDHKFTFNEGVSLMVNCDTQAEIDYYSEKLSAVPEAEQCGWVKDKYGVSWQIVPANMDELMKGEDEAATARKTQAMLKMKKLDIETLKNA